jgi:hypothetical protein
MPDIGPCQCKECVRHRLTYGTRVYDQDGYDTDGYDWNALNRDGRDIDGYDRNGVNEDGYDRDGKPRHVDSAELNLAELWAAYTEEQKLARSVTEEFLSYLRGITTDPDNIDDVQFCGDCGIPGWPGDMTGTAHETPICDACAEKWETCDSCDEKYPPDSTTRTLGGCDICSNCRSEYYSWCGHCEGYYHDDDDSHYHDDDDDCGCASPQLEFTIRNDGEEPLSNDTRVTVTLPAGTITREGLQAIRRHIFNHDIFVEIDALGDQWQTKTGNYTRRLSKLAYQNGIKVPPDVLSQVGCIARDHSKSVDVEIDVTRDLNQSASDFYHDDSCWWGQYAESRCALKTSGGFGLRTFGRCGSVSGRAWAMPLKKEKNGNLTPTFNTMTPDAFIVFNGYGDLSGYAPARIMAHMAGWTYRKITFTCSPMYVNSPSGYLVAGEELASECEALHLNIPQHSDLFDGERETL